MSPVRMVARLLRPFCRLVEWMVVGHAQERAEAKLRHPSVQVSDDVMIDLADGQHDRLPDDERAELDTFVVDFRRWSVAMWDGLDADRIARRRERAGWDR